MLVNLGIAPLATISNDPQLSWSMAIFTVKDENL